MAVRTDLESRLHRLANFTEAQLVDVIRELIVEQRIEAIHDFSYTATRLIESCRTIRDGREREGVA